MVVYSLAKRPWTNVTKLATANPSSVKLITCRIRKEKRFLDPDAYVPISQ